MFAAVLICCGGGLTSCVEKEDNPVSGVDDPDVVVQEPLEIDPNEFQQTDVSVALLGSLSDYAKEEAVCYWFPNVQDKVTDETMVVITDEITAANEADILKVLNRYGMLLLVDPKDDNVHQYGGYFGVDPNVDCSKVELLGLTGLGDQFVSYVGDDEKASDDPIAPPYIAGDDISDIDPEAYLRLKAFAQWVEIVDKKYTDYHNKLAERKKAIADAIAEFDAGDVASARRLLTRADEGGDKKQSESNKIDINSLLGRSVCAELTKDTILSSYSNRARSDDKDTCYLSVTCNYNLKPLYEFPKGNAPGADYYIVETSVNWDCSKTLKGYKMHDHGPVARARRSYLFFPIMCKFHSEPLPTSSKYSPQMLAGDGDLKPDNVLRKKTVKNIRSLSIDTNLSGGWNTGRHKDSAANYHGGKAEASLGICAKRNKEETFTVQEYDVSKLVDGQKVGHVISVPGGEDGYHPKMVNKSLDYGFEVSGGVNFAKTLSTNESWVWKISGTEVDTDDPSIRVKFEATPRVSWSSYFHTYTEWGVIEHDCTISRIITFPVPNRRNSGLVKINNTGDGKSNDLAIFGIKITDVTDQNKPVVAYNNFNSVLVPSGNSYSISLSAGHIYDMELEMGPKSDNTKMYRISRPWKVVGIAELGGPQELATNLLFNEVGK
jgi:hypothetical protein